MRQITELNQLDLNKSYTYADYLTWQFQERVELIMGKIFSMSPAPKSQHQQIVVRVTSAIFNFLKKKHCKVFPSPFDVRLPVTNKKGELNTVVQPDICVICDLAKIDEDGCNGAPDLVIEIVSKHSVTRDLHEKYDLYEKCGVQEYWILHPNDKTLTLFFLNQQGKYVPSKPLTYGDTPKSHVLPGLSIDLNEVFEDVVKEPEEGYLPEGYVRL
jgi:Uma2 family endonuclease